jgi:hypothetical protein
MSMSTKHWWNDTEMDVTDTGSGDVHWFHVTQDRYQSQTLIHMPMHIQIHTT